MLTGAWRPDRLPLKKRSAEPPLPRTGRVPVLRAGAEQAFSLENFAFEIIQFQKRAAIISPQAGQAPEKRGFQAHSTRVPANAVARAV
ncbi:hypothetical protein [Desulfovibrio sp. ZJ200]|uniref:hypothetical protein n=1 Tax=Desulfovibrio sp. ZJ200 TaxID=2709792 RepID=UPI00197FECFB|nr:hypothetical protein [Desulfovibrio sp. ZJ200]